MIALAIVLLTTSLTGAVFSWFVFLRPLHSTESNENNPTKHTESHNPNDWHSGPNATPWKHEARACPCCHATIGHDEFMLGRCFTCARDSSCLDFKILSWRKIRVDGTWLYQIRFDEGEWIRPTRLRKDETDRVGETKASRAQRKRDFELAALVHIKSRIAQIKNETYRMGRET